MACFSVVYTVRPSPPAPLPMGEGRSPKHVLKVGRRERDAMLSDIRDAKSDLPVLPGPVIRETVCKTILNRSGLEDYSLNCYTGCTHRCVYCYARFMQRFHPHEEPWGNFVDVKVNAAEALKRQLRRARPGSVFVSSACDGWQPIEADRRLTRRCCELLLERGFRLSCSRKVN